MKSRDDSINQFSEDLKHIMTIEKSGDDNHLVMEACKALFIHREQRIVDPNRVDRVTWHPRTVDSSIRAWSKRRKKRIRAIPRTCHVEALMGSHGGSGDDLDNRFGNCEISVGGECESFFAPHGDITSSTCSKIHPDMLSWDVCGKGIALHIETTAKERLASQFPLSKNNLLRGDIPKLNSSSIPTSLSWLALSHFDVISRGAKSQARDSTTSNGNCEKRSSSSSSMEKVADGSKRGRKRTKVAAVTDGSGKVGKQKRSSTRSSRGKGHKNAATADDDKLMFDEDSSQETDDDNDNDSLVEGGKSSRGHKRLKRVKDLQKTKKRSKSDVKTEMEPVSPQPTKKSRGELFRYLQSFMVNWGKSERLPIKKKLLGKLYSNMAYQDSASERSSATSSPSTPTVSLSHHHQQLQRTGIVSPPHRQLDSMTPPHHAPYQDQNYQQRNDQHWNHTHHYHHTAMHSHSSPMSHGFMEHNRDLDPSRSVEQQPFERPFQSPPPSPHPFGSAPPPSQSPTNQRIALSNGQNTVRASHQEAPTFGTTKPHPVRMSRTESTVVTDSVESERVSRNFTNDGTKSSDAHRKTHKRTSVLGANTTTGLNGLTKIPKKKKMDTADGAPASTLSSHADSPLSSTPSLDNGVAWPQQHARPHYSSSSPLHDQHMQRQQHQQLQNQQHQ